MNKRKDIIPNNLKQFRKACGYNQQQVANLLGFTSFDRISHWEKGDNIPNLINLFKLSVLYHATPMQLYPELMDRMSDEVSQRREEKFVTVD